MDLLKFRKELHQHPELSGNESHTAKVVAEKLRAVGVNKVQQNFAEHSLLAEIEFPQPGKTILFRCELDALPINEENEFAHRSKISNISHKCGHDGHIAILLGLAERLTQVRNFSGKALFLFQSSEETGKGAQAIIRSEILNHYDIHQVFALHNVPGYPLGSVVCKPGSFTPAVESLDILLEGKESHAGMPEKGINPAKAVAEIIRYFGQIHQPEKVQHFLATPIQVQMGRPAYGTSAGDALISYTFRGNEPQLFKQQKSTIVQEVKKRVMHTSKLNAPLPGKKLLKQTPIIRKLMTSLKKVQQKTNFLLLKSQPLFHGVKTSGVSPSFFQEPCLVWGPEKILLNFTILIMIFRMR